MQAEVAEDAGETASYRVVVNHEARYSIWPGDQANPPGWSDEGTSGSRENCLHRIEEVWTDMRPLSVRARAV